MSLEHSLPTLLDLLIKGAIVAFTASGDVQGETADALILAQNAEVRPTEATPAPPKSAALEKAGKIILPKIELQDVKVRAAAAYLATKSRELDPEGKGVNVVVKLPETDTTTVTLSLENVPLSEALKYLAELAGLEMEAGAEAVLLCPPKTIAPALPKPAAGTPEAAVLDRARGILIPRMEFKDATVDEGIEFLRKKSGELDLEKKPVNIVVQHSKTSADVKLTLSFTNISVAEALGYVAQLAGLQLEVGKSALVLRPRGE